MVWHKGDCVLRRCHCFTLVRWGITHTKINEQVWYGSIIKGAGQLGCRISYDGTVLDQRGSRRPPRQIIKE